MRDSATARTLVRCLLPAVLLAAAGAARGQEAATRPASDSPGVLTTGGRTPYVHRITLYDASGRAISPADADPQPYSPAMTCGKCHDVAAVRKGYHFRPGPEPVDYHLGGLSDTPPRRSEPWLVADPQTGRAREANDLSADAFIRRFGAFVPGQYVGQGRPEEAAWSRPPAKEREQVSGAFEIDCMICHSADRRYDLAERAAQLERQNFKWAPTAAIGLGSVKGSAADARVLDATDPAAIERMADPAYEGPADQGIIEGLPKLAYDRTRFDADGRVFMDITRRIPPENCYRCHTNRTVGQGAEPRWLHDGDVHVARGMLCVDCHRNGIDHEITRGYPGEAADRGRPELAGFTCAGCHSDGPHGGRLAAPVPQHRGLPASHLNHMSCTACHSGPRPAADTWRIQTSMAHGLGLPRQQRGDDDPPAIYGPVMRGNDRGPIAPYRLAYADEKAGALYWPIAHDVRPAGDALGARGCIDCHASDAPFVFGMVPDATGAPALPMHSYNRADPGLLRALAVLLPFKPLFLAVMFLATAVILITLLRYPPPASGPIPEGRRTRLWRRLLTGGLFASLVAIGLVAATEAFLNFIFNAWWTAIVHPFAAAVLAVCLAGLMRIWSSQRRFAGRARATFWVFGWIGLAAVASITLATGLPLTTREQTCMVVVHGVSSVLLLFAAIIHVGVSGRLERRNQRRSQT